MALVNDYEVIVAGIKRMLEPFSAWVEVVELDVECNPDHTVEVALFDSFGRSHLGIERVRSLVKEAKVGSVAVYTWTVAPAHRQELIEAGAQGVISKSVSAESLVEALLAVDRGEVVVCGGFRGRSEQPAWPGWGWDLTLRESEVLALLSTGMRNTEIADALFLSENTVRTHLKSLYRKLGVSNRTQAAARVLASPEFAVRPGGDRPGTGS